MRNRLPIVLSALALVIAVLGWTGVGGAALTAATKAVKTALFAKNAGRVNGIQASKTPTPGKLLPLGSDGKFPSSAIPAQPPSGGGGGGGTSTPGPDSVGSDQVIDGSLTGADIKDESLTSADVKDGSLTGADVAADSLKGAQIDESSLGKVPSATNADQLGGIAASSYRHDCVDGTVKAKVIVNGSTTFPSNYTAASPFIYTSFSCDGVPVQVRRTGTATYLVRFGNALDGVATGNVVGDTVGDRDYLIWQRRTDVDNKLSFVVTLVDHNGNGVDKTFALVLS